MVQQEQNNIKVRKINRPIESFNKEKIAISINNTFNRLYINNIQLVNSITDTIEQQIISNGLEEIDVDQIRDLIEKELSKRCLYKEAKEYILYRAYKEKRNLIIEKVKNLFGDKVYQCIKKYNLDIIKLQNLFESINTNSETIKGDYIKASLTLISDKDPNWDFVAGTMLEVTELPTINIDTIYEDFVESNVWHKSIKESLTKEQFTEYIEEFFNRVDSNPHFFSYSAVDLLRKRYIIRDINNVIKENIPLMYFGISAFLFSIKNTNVNIVDYAELLYHQNMTMATPTMSNARKLIPTLSSCFVDTIDDSLDGIYHSLHNFARVSKNGGGMGIYAGKIRANGSDIRDVEGAAGGVIRWIKLFNDTAIAVDQLNVRTGAVSITLDIWHKDITDFLQLKTNNGDDRKKAHDIFPALSIPDYFWELCQEDLNNTWYLFCPHQIKKVTGESLEDKIGEEWTKFYLQCINNEAIPRETIKIKELIRLMIKSLVETGGPFVFNRDNVNNNNHIKDSIIYSSNLCSEIALPMDREVYLRSTNIDKDSIADIYKLGEYPTCNLASINLSAFYDKQNNDINYNKLQDVVRKTIFALDNVIDLNVYPNYNAEHTSKNYRSVGLGTSGYQHLLALMGVSIDSDRAIGITEQLYRFIYKSAIEASIDIAEAYGVYPRFKKEYYTKEFFEKLGIYEDSPTYKKFLNSGIRNAYLIAIAPTGSTSVIANTTPGIDPIINKYFIEEKKGSMIPRVAPDLNDMTFWTYKEAHLIDQKRLIDLASIRQKYIDQAQYLNLFITPEYSFREILDLYIYAWRKGIKTIYYLRSKSLEVEECISCSS